MKTSWAFGFVLFALLPFSAEARVFSYKEASLAAYVRGTGAMSGASQDAFENSDGTNTSIDGTTRYAYSGELGASMVLTNSIIMRLGAELIQHHPIKAEPGRNPLEQKRFDLDSSIVVFNPNVTFEYIYSMAGALRFYGLVGAGMAQVTVENRYTMTAQGTADLAVTDFAEKMEGSAISYHLGVGLETLFTANSTVAFDFGYRYLPINKLTYKGNVNNIVSPTGVAKGDVAKNHDGTDRTLNLGGVFAGFTLRFYFNFL